MESDANISHNEMLFLQVVSMFQVAAMQQMGKIPNPMTNEMEKDLDQAKMSVDILAMLKEKTKGNLSKQEEEFLAKIVFESQMNYLDELDRLRGEATEGPWVSDPGCIRENAYVRGPECIVAEMEESDCDAADAAYITAACTEKKVVDFFDGHY